MSVEFKFNIVSLTVAPFQNGIANVVTAVVWQVVATDGTHYAQRTETHQLGEADKSKFVAYDGLTEEIVKGWIPDYSADEDIRKYLADNIAEQADPPLVIKSPPWAG